MTDRHQQSEILVATATRLHGLACNLASSNLAEQSDESQTMSSPPPGAGDEPRDWASTGCVGRGAGNTRSFSRWLSWRLDIEIACVQHTQNLIDDELESIYNSRPDSEEDCLQVCYSDGYSGHYLCESVINEATFPCLGCPISDSPIRGPPFTGQDQTHCGARRRPIRLTRLAIRVPRPVA